MVDGRRGLGHSGRVLDSKLVASVQALIDSDETVSSAFVAVKGSRPGIEALTLFPFTLALLVTGSYPLAVVVGVVGFVTVVARRKFRTVALTDRNVVLLANSYRRPRRAASLLTRLPCRGAISPPDESKGDKRIAINGETYWLYPRDLDESRRMTKLTAA